MPTGLSGGAQVYVRGTLRSVSVPISASKLSTALHSLDQQPSTSSSSSNNIAINTQINGSSSSLSSISPSSISPPPAYTSIYPPSPPQSQPSSPQNLPTLTATVVAAASSRPSSIRSNTSITSGAFKNPLQTALSSPCKPVKPVLTHRSSCDSVSSSSDNISLTNTKFNVLSTIFPKASPVHSLPYEFVDLTEFSSNWKGVVLENPAMGTRTLFVVGGEYNDVNMRESVCGVLEKAEEELNCTGLVMCLEKDNKDFGELIHQLLYVGGTITNGPFTPRSKYVLVGMDV